MPSSSRTIRLQAKIHLTQPRHTTAIWVQRTSGWEVYPPDVPLLNRDIIVSPAEDPLRTNCDAVDVDGSPGGCCFSWHLEK